MRKSGQQKAILLKTVVTCMLTWSFPRNLNLNLTERYKRCSDFWGSQPTWSKYTTKRASYFLKVWNIAVNVCGQ